MGANRVPTFQDKSMNRNLRDWKPFEEICTRSQLETMRRIGWVGKKPRVVNFSIKSLYASLAYGRRGFFSCRYSLKSLDPLKVVFFA